MKASILSNIGCVLFGCALVLAGGGCFLEARDNQNPWQAVVAVLMGVLGVGFVAIGWAA